jgi:fibronectin-binding autotransporter adhesin
MGEHSALGGACRAIPSATPPRRRALILRGSVWASVTALMPVTMAALMVALASTAFADGGAGSAGNLTFGGPGGADSATGTGGTGGSGIAGNQGGGGGGGAGVTGGTGGAGGGIFGSSGGAGGAGGATAGAAGTAGSDNSNGGGGGGGGAHGFVGAGLPGTASTGGNGGAGGNNISSGGNSDGGGGGAGAYGAVVTGSGNLGTLEIALTGGNGGAGGQGSPNNAFFGGNGGSGGTGLLFTNSAGVTLTINAAIQGGTGGAGGVIGGGTNGSNGPSGPGLAGQNLTITVGPNGSITGGGAANAITFTGGTNSLTLVAGSTINGNVVGAGGDIFQLGGSGSSPFNLSLLGTQYTGFSIFNVTGGNWTTSGTSAQNWGISGGNLILNSSITGTLTLTGGELSGTGTAGTLTNTAGTVSPGPPGGVGTLMVNGNYTQGSNGTLTIEVSPNAASKLVAGGAANLGGTLALVFAPGTYAPNSYTLLTATSLTGTFATVTGTNPSGLPQTIVYEPDPSVVLQLSPATSAPIIVAPTNDTIFSAATSVAVINAQQANGIILDRVGARQAGIAAGEMAAHPPGGGMPGTQLAQAGGGNGAALGAVAASLPGTLPEGAWFRGIGGFASVNGNSTAPGFTGSTGGFLAGYDRPVLPNVYLGVAGGYLHSNIDEHSTSNGSEGSARLNVYSGLIAGPSLFSATAGYANDRFVTNRGFTGIGTANESHNGNEATAAAQWSLPLPIPGYGGGVATLTPKAGIQYLHLSEDTFNETGAGGLDLGNSGHGTDSLQPYVGAAVSQKFVTDGGAQITPELRLGYAHDVFDSRLLTVTSVTGAAFPVEGVKPSRDQLTAGLGVTMIAGPNLSLYADYDAIVPTGNITEQTIQAGLRWKF